MVWWRERGYDDDEGSFAAVIMVAKVKMAPPTEGRKEGIFCPIGEAKYEATQGRPLFSGPWHAKK